MKVLHVTEAMGGGVQNAISKYTHLLASDQHIVFGRPRPGESAGEFAANTRVIEYSGSLINYLLKVRTLVKSERPDVVHIHSSFAGLARLLAPTTSPLVYSPHCYAFERRDKSRVWQKALRLAEQILAVRPQTLVAVSPHEARLGSLLNSRMPVHFVPNAVPKMSAAVGKDERPSVTMVGRIGWQKDPNLFAEVAELVGGNIDFVWVGDGDPEMKKRLLEAGVRVSGWVSPEQARRKVAASHLYVHTGAWEAAPISAIEAATLGTPVIARAIPTMSSLGYYTVAEPAHRIAESIRTFFSDPGHKQLVTEMTEAVARKHTVEDARRILVSAYDSAIGTHQHRRSQGA
ncbi:glycosyl transferase [Arthrobacter sp. StoSoilB22]|nr:glycosyl transferase [Arthrobacter sp. StoSoilB22]